MAEEGLKRPSQRLQQFLEISTAQDRVAYRRKATHNAVTRVPARFRFRVQPDEFLGPVTHSGQEIRPGWAAVIAGVAQDEDDGVAGQEAFTFGLPEMLEHPTEVRPGVQVKLVMRDDIALLERDLAQAIHIGEGADLAEIVMGRCEQGE